MYYISIIIYIIRMVKTSIWSIIAHTEWGLETSLEDLWLESLTLAVILRHGLYDWQDLGKTCIIRRQLSWKCFCGLSREQWWAQIRTAENHFHYLSVCEGGGVVVELFRVFGTDRRFITTGECYSNSSILVGIFFSIQNSFPEIWLSFWILLCFHNLEINFSCT